MDGLDSVPLIFSLFLPTYPDYKNEHLGKSNPKHMHLGLHHKAGTEDIDLDSLFLVKMCQNVNIGLTPFTQRT